MDSRACREVSAMFVLSQVPLLTGSLLRLCIWYALVTPFLRCPSRLADLTETSPRVCKPYLIARSALKQAQAYGIEQWQNQVTPRLETAQNKVHQLYIAEIDPYVQQSVAVVSPYYQWANTVVRNLYQGHLVPFYARSRPFIGKAYSTSQGVLTTHVLPGAQYTWSSAVYFANSSLWPHVTGLYSEQVEPQLVKIGQRLASYREGKRLRAVIEDVDRYL